MTATRKGFAPVVPSRPQIVILGSMPSVRSLAAQQYYAHPGNAFWPLICRLAGAPETHEYACRIALLERAGIALWDVLAACERPGSLDHAILTASEQPNDIAGLLHRNPTIKAVALNGGRAQQCFRRHIWSGLKNRDSLTIVCLPSSSPANARMNRTQKYAAWAPIRQFLRS